MYDIQDISWNYGSSKNNRRWQPKLSNKFRMQAEQSNEQDCWLHFKEANFQLTASIWTELWAAAP